MSDAPLPISKDHWRSRWLQRATPRGTRLHRIAQAVWDDPPDMIACDGVTVCGERGRFLMPGFISRIEAQRCPACCRALSLPNGRGAPMNDETLPEDKRDD